MIKTKSERTTRKIEIVRQTSRRNYVEDTVAKSSFLEFTDRTMVKIKRIRSRSRLTECKADENQPEWP